jgi:hypothetical protein
MESIVAIGVFYPTPGFNQRPGKFGQRKLNVFCLIPRCYFENLLFQIRFYGCFPPGETLEKSIDGRCRQLNGQHPAVEHVLPEDTGKAFGNNQMNTVYFQGPGGMLTGRTAAEIRAGNDDAFAGDIFLSPETIYAEIFKKVRL